MPRGYGASYGMLNRRPIYDEDELTGPEYLSRGISGAIDYFMKQREAGRLEQNEMAKEGAVALPEDPNANPMGRLRGIKRGIGALLHRGQAQTTPPFVPPSGPGEVPQGPYIDESGAFGQPGPQRIRGGIMMPNRPRPTPPFNPQKDYGGSRIGARIFDEIGGGGVPPYTLEGQSGRRYQIDPMRDQRIKLAGSEMEYGQQRGHVQAEQERQIAAAVAAGMPEPEARARVLNNLMRYDEEFGQRSRSGSGMTQADRLQIQDRLDRRAAATRAMQLRLQTMRSGSAEERAQLQAEVSRLNREQQADLATLRSYDQQAASAEGAVTRMSADPAATAMPAGRERLGQEQQRAKTAADSAAAARSRVQNRGTRKSVQDRDSELKAQGKNASERLRILKAEGYNVTGKP